MRRYLQFLGFAACGALAFAGIARADSVAPSTFIGTVAVGDDLVIDKVVTIDDAPPVDALVDVFLLCDSTGSMSDEIAAVKASALDIVGSTAMAGDVQFGAGEYRDFGDAFAYRTNTDLT